MTFKPNSLQQVIEAIVTNNLGYVSQNNKRNDKTYADLQNRLYSLNEIQVLPNWEKSKKLPKYIK